MFALIASQEDSTRAAGQIDRAITRALDAAYRIHWATPDEMHTRGYMYWLVPSSRAGHPSHRVAIRGGRLMCDCEAHEYGEARRQYVCVHAMTVLIRLKRAKRRGTRAMARVGWGVLEVDRTRAA